jgi:N-acetylglucosamine-6-phosphate deacetylase
VARGIVVSIGHSLAEPSDVRAAVAAGARFSTHLGNGIPTFVRRHPNLVWEQLGTDELTAMFIADGHHLDLTTLRTMIRAKEAPRWLLVSDTTSLGGLPPGRYRTHIGGEVELAESGRLGMVGTGYLAGAAVSLRHGLATALSSHLASGRDSVSAVTSRPAAALGRRAADRGALEPGRRADVVVARWDDAHGSLSVQETWVRGRTVWSAP